MEHRMVDVGDRGAGTASALTLVTGALMVTGVVMVATTTASPNRDVFRDGFLSSTFGRQLVFVLVGAVLLALLKRGAGSVFQSPTWRNRTAVAMFGVTVLALVMTLVSGLADPHRGSHRWLNLTFLGINTGIQPSEFAKPALVLFLSAMLSRFDPRSFKQGLLPAAGAIGLCTVLVGTEDFGTAALIGGTGAAMLIVAGCRWRYLAGFAGMGLVGMIGLILAEPYRLERIAGFRHVWTDTQGAAYQPLQSLVTIASGGWLGRGLGAGVQKLGYLPEAHSDFVFAVVCEETGVVGAMLVIALFVGMGLLGLSVIRNAQDPFRRLLAFGLTATILLQALMNMAVVTVLTPTTGIPLPFISAGGSGLISACVSVGLLCAVARSNDHSCASPLFGHSPKHDASGLRWPSKERSLW